MKKNYESTGSEAFESKEFQSAKNILSKFDYDLFDEDKDVVEKVIRVKRVQLPNSGEKWKIFENTKTVFVLDGSKISKKEKEFLRTADGFNFLIAQYREGIKSLNNLRVELKNKIK